MFAEVTEARLILGRAGLRREWRAATVKFAESRLAGAAPLVIRRRQDGLRRRHAAGFGRIADGSHARAGFDSPCRRAMP
jgi:hypothetical protein